MPLASQPWWAAEEVALARKDDPAAKPARLKLNIDFAVQLVFDATPDVTGPETFL
jgi:hypothetical protein